jgi:hypothetical protein
MTIRVRYQAVMGRVDWFDVFVSGSERWLGRVARDRQGRWTGTARGLWRDIALGARATRGDAALALADHHGITERRRTAA